MRSDAVHAVIAVKGLDHAKSRLGGRLRPEHRGRLVLAMLADTMTATHAVADIHSITVVTPDPAVAAVARAMGAVVHPEPRHRLVNVSGLDGLNTALADAAAAVRQRYGPTGLLALQADLPALRSAELTEMLAVAPHGRRSMVVDHSGDGTAALLVRDYTAALDPQFGPESARRHQRAGAAPLTGGWPGLRLDVDTAADLDRAIEIGAGAATHAVLDDIGWFCRVHG